MTSNPAAQFQPVLRPVIIRGKMKVGTTLTKCLYWKLQPELWEPIKVDNENVTANYSKLDC